MCTRDRIEAYQDMHQDPAGYLAQHYDVRPDTEEAVIEDLFERCAAVTGRKSQDVVDAVESFRESGVVRDFVQQAASGMLLKEIGHWLGSTMKIALLARGDFLFICYIVALWTRKT